MLGGQDAEASWSGSVAEEVPVLDQPVGALWPCRSGLGMRRAPGWHQGPRLGLGNGVLPLQKCQRLSVLGTGSDGVTANLELTFFHQIYE